MNNDYYVYCHIRLDNNEPFYIGKGRKSRCYETSKRSQFWKNIYNKYGRKVTFIAKGLTNDEAIKIEMEQIKIYGRLDNNTGILCNLTDGGEGGGYGRKKDNKGVKNPMYGKKQTDETKKIISELAKERFSDPKNHPLYGKLLSDEVKIKKSNSMKNFYKNNICTNIGKKHTEEHINNYKKTVQERGSHKMSNNSKAISFIYENKTYGCFKELWLEKYTHLTYRYWVSKFDRTKIQLIN